jgi:hypothetical protein
MASFSLNCMLFGESPELAFVVDVDPTKRIDHLREAIKTKRSDVFRGVPTVLMNVWKVDIALDTPSEKLSALKETGGAGPSDSYIQTAIGGERLRALQQIGKAFQSEANDELIQVPVERPTRIIECMCRL